MSKSRPSQPQRIMSYLKSGKTLDRIEAIRNPLVSVIELSDKIIQLEKSGVKIEKGWREYKNRYGEKIRLRTYKLMQLDINEERENNN